MALDNDEVLTGMQNFHGKDLQNLKEAILKGRTEEVIKIKTIGFQPEQAGTKKEHHCPDCGNTWVHAGHGCPTHCPECGNLYDGECG